ncbi:MAG: flagellar biosynthetic protein FliR [Hydrogenibacillus sp.]|nr:flagellar biosynthetic protein FliR [Hydrogenibacillus sp.]
MNAPLADTLAYAVLVTVRLAAFFLVATPFNLRGFPIIGKLGLALLIALLVVPARPERGAVTEAMFPLAVLSAVFTGLLLGFAVQVFFALFETAGGLIDYQMGMAIVSVIDPATGAGQPIIGQLKTLFALFVFFVSGAHRTLIAAVLKSFDTLAVERVLSIDGPLIPRLVDWAAQTFVFGFLFAAPIVAVLFILDVAIALLSRAVPQMNVFVVGLPLKIIVAHLALLAFLGGLALALEPLFDRLTAAVLELPLGVGG